MAYTGTTVPIPLGQLGLATDDPQAAIAPNAAITANNISLFRSRIEKSPGSSKYSATALSAAVVGLFDWYPTASTQRLVAATADGKLWKDTGDGTWSSSTALATVEVQKISFASVPTSGAWSVKQGANTPTGTVSVLVGTTAAEIQAHIRTISGLSAVVVSGTVATGFLVRFDGTTGNQVMLEDNSNTLNGTSVAVTYTEVFQGAATLGVLTPDCQFVAGGAEASGSSRKLFFFSSTTQAKVLIGDGSAIGNIRAPAADWASTFPTFGIIFQGRLVALKDHRIYISKWNDHEDFTTTAVDGSGAASFPIFTGEGDGLVSAAVFKGSLLLFKKPFGIYVFNWNGGPLDEPENVSISRLSDSFAVASPHSPVQVLDDLLSGSMSGSIFSLKATSAYGSLEAGDVLANQRVRDYVRQQLNSIGIPYQHSLYYPEKEQAFFTGRSTAASSQNRMLVLDFSRQAPRMTIETKDQPTCLALRKDSNGIQRPIYGSDGGFVFLMDQATRSVAGAGYNGEFQTPYVDFSYLDGSLADKTKLFDFLQITYTAVGNWPFYVDVMIDGTFVETITYNMSQGIGLGTFRLDIDRLGNITPKTNRRPMHGSGKAISFRMYNNTVNEYFSVERLVVGFRVGAEGNKSSTT